MDPKFSTEPVRPSHIFRTQVTVQPVVFEDYLYYASIQRQEEEEEKDGSVVEPVSGNLEADGKKPWFPRVIATNEGIETKPRSAELPPMTPHQVERANASRALRLASWLSVFYLITTDILAPFNAPYAISQVGWIPGVILYFFMGVAATYSGLILWLLYMKLDSLRYPLRTYADMAERIFGKAARHVCNLLQSIQLIMTVGLVCLGCGQGLSQVVQGRLCFSVCVVIFPIIGMIIGQIRTLKNFSWLASSAVWIILAIMFISMGFVAHSTPNYDAAKLSLGVDPGPVVTAKYVSLPFFYKINGVMQMVFAYGGAMIFPEIMAEMRRPMDFWKGFTLAQLLIFCAYLFYGCFVYAFQGQFTLPLAFQGVDKYSWQTVGNVLGLVPALVIAGLYSNIGIKVIYNNIFEEWFRGPPLMSFRGRVIWTILVFLYWSFAFIIGSAIPQLANIVGLIGAVGIMQFTYAFPPLLLFGYEVIVDAMSEDRPYVPCNGTRGRVDTWHNWSRWKRGLFGGRWFFKMFNLVVGIGGLATACLGMWASGESIKASFQLSGSAASFGCTSPV